MYYKDDQYVDNQGMMESVRLEKIKICITEHIDKNLLMEANIDILKDMYSRRFALQLTGFIYGERSPETTIQYPSTWWDAFKIRWFNKYLLKKYPAKYTTHHIQFNVMYPDFKYALPEGQRFIDLVRYKT